MALDSCLKLPRSQAEGKEIDGLLASRPACAIPMALPEKSDQKWNDNPPTPCNVFTVSLSKAVTPAP